MTVFDYDFNEFTGIPGTDFDLDDIKKNPENYLNKVVNHKPIVGPAPETTVRVMQKKIETQQTDIDAISDALQELILAQMGGTEE